MSERLKCTTEHVCNTMKSRLNDPYSRTKGMRAVHTINLDTGKTRLLGVSYHTSASDKGLLLNNCPWCGGQPGYFERR